MTKTKEIGNEAKLKEISGEHCGQCSFFNKVGKVWACTGPVPEYCFFDEDADPPAVVYVRGFLPTLSSAPACWNFKPRMNS